MGSLDTLVVSVQASAPGEPLYEFHIAHDDKPRLELSTEDVAGFVDPEAEITAISMISWGEHCTECAWPECYTTCDLYEARIDGHCRRFAHGMVPRPDVATATGWGVEIAFKRWGKLMATAGTSLVPLAAARATARSAQVLDKAADRLSGLRVAGRDYATVRVQGRLKAALGRLDQSSIADRLDTVPDYFLVEVFSAESETIPLTLAIADAIVAPDRKSFQDRLDVAPGTNRFRIPYERIRSTVGTPERLEIELMPNILTPEDEGLTLVFGTLQFVRDGAWNPPVAFVKAVIWDLDNTLWDGVLIEDGLDGIGLRAEVAETIRALDRRGIVNSIASKNNPEDAIVALESFGLADLFVFPEISWDPKSDAVARIIDRLNVGADAIVFIDDQPFERAEVATTHPDVTILDGSGPIDLLDRPEFDPPVSVESSGRRLSYQNQERRDEARETTGGDYESFLRDCEIRVRLNDASAHEARVQELIQRTNQMNFSGRRYSRDELTELLAGGATECFAVEVEDRFGSYGTVGFAAVDTANAAPTVVDLAFSCRVQSKRVEHGVLAHLMGRYHDGGAEEFLIRYRPTEKNAPSARVFDDLGFETREDDGETRLLRYDMSDRVPAVELLTVEDNT